MCSAHPMVSLYAATFVILNHWRNALTHWNAKLAKKNMLFPNLPIGTAFQKVWKESWRYMTTIENKETSDDPKNKQQEQWEQV